MLWDLRERRARLALPIGEDGRLTRGLCLLVIGGLSVLSWGALIGAVLALRSLF
jgi:hypothetical protein